MWFRGFPQLVLLWCLLLLWLHLQQEATAEPATLTRRFWSKILSPVIQHNNVPSCSPIASCCDLVEAPNVKPGQILDSNLQGRARMLQEAPFGNQREVWFLKLVLNWFHSMVEYCFPGKNDRQPQSQPSEDIKKLFLQEQSLPLIPCLSLNLGSYFHLT